MSEEWEIQLRRKVKPIYFKGRKTDWRHVQRAVKYGKSLIQKEKGEYSIVIPAIYLHDTGWSEVPFDSESKNVERHMQIGSQIAKRILTKLGYDSNKTEAIAKIISIHDNPKAVFDLNDKNATLVVEADRLDRFGPDAIERYEEMFANKITFEKFLERNRMGIDKWFRTKTAKSLATKLLDEEAKEWKKPGRE